MRCTSLSILDVVQKQLTELFKTKQLDDDLLEGVETNNSINVQDQYMHLERKNNKKKKNSYFYFMST